jgi:hypothetical protein
MGPVTLRCWMCCVEGSRFFGRHETRSVWRPASELPAWYRAPTADCFLICPCCDTIHGLWTAPARVDEPQAVLTW